MRKVAKGISIFAAWPLLLALVLGAIVSVSFSPGVYADEHAKLNIAQTVGCSPSVLENITNRLIGFMKGGSSAPLNLDMNAQINGENREVFSDREKYHMYDVKYLFDLARYAQTICIIAAALSLACAFLLGRKGRRLVDLSAGILWGMASFFVAALILGAIIYLDFQKFWTTFHQVLFDNELWQLDPSRDVLIQMMPEEFFKNMILRIALMFAAMAAALAVLAGMSRLLMGRKLAPEDAKPAKAAKQLPSDETVTAIQADDGERFVLNAEGPQERPAAEEIFEGFGLSDKDDQPLMPDETHTTRPLAAPRMEVEAVQATVPVPETEIQFVMPKASGPISFEPEKQFKLSDDETSNVADTSGLTFVGKENEEVEGFMDVSATGAAFKFQFDEPDQEAASSEEDEEFTLRQVTGSSAEYEETLEGDSVRQQETVQPVPAEGLISPEPEAQPPVEQPVLQTPIEQQPQAPASAGEIVAPERTRSAPAPRRAPPPRYVDDEPETEIYSPGDDRERRVSRRRQVREQPQPERERHLSVHVPVTIPASQVDIQNLGNGVKLELKLELRLLEDGSLVPAMPSDAVKAQQAAVESVPEAIPESEPIDGEEPSISELLSRMDQIMASFPGDEGEEH